MPVLHAAHPPTSSTDDLFGLSLPLVENRNLATMGIPTPTTKRGPAAAYCGDVTLTTKQLERRGSVATLRRSPLGVSLHPPSSGPPTLPRTRQRQDQGNWCSRINEDRRCKQHADFETAVDQQTRAHDWIFEGVPDSGWTPVPAGQPRPYLVNSWPNLPNHLNTIETMLWGALLVATSLLNTRIQVLSKLDEKNTICTYLGKSTKYNRCWPIDWANINIFEWNQLDVKSKPKLHIFYEYQLNIYLTMDSVVQSSQKITKIALDLISKISIFKQLTSFKIITQ